MLWSAYFFITEIRCFYTHLEISACDRTSPFYHVERLYHKLLVAILGHLVMEVIEERHDSRVRVLVSWAPSLRMGFYKNALTGHHNNKKFFLFNTIIPHLISHFDVSIIQAIDR